MEAPIFREVLLKLASRCNLNCTYCYWFRDASVYHTPPILTSEAEGAFLVKLESHLLTYRLERFSLLLHGGEPLLFGKPRFVRLLDALLGIQQRTGCALRISLTTNGVLIDQEWAQLFRIFGLQVTVSIDGPATIHDRVRRDFKDHGSYDRVLRGVQLLREQGLEPGVLAVCDPTSDPRETLEHFVEELGFTDFDILLPDVTHEDTPPSIASYYKGLFDSWYDHYWQRGVSVRYMKNVVADLLDAHRPGAEYSPAEILTVLTDGSLEPVDVLRIAGNESTKTKLSLLTHSFQDITQDPGWREAYHASRFLPSYCQACDYFQACRGGYLPHRWSRTRGYDNPSVYCADLKDIYGHVWQRLVPTIQVEQDGVRKPLLAVIGEMEQE